MLGHLQTSRSHCAQPYVAVQGIGLVVLWFRDLGKSITAPFAVLK